MGEGYSSKSYQSRKRLNNHIPPKGIAIINNIHMTSGETPFFIAKIDITVVEAVHRNRVRRRISVLFSFRLVVSGYEERKRFVTKAAVVAIKMEKEKSVITKKASKIGFLAPLGHTL